MKLIAVLSVDLNDLASGNGGWVLDPYKSGWQTKNRL